MTFKPRLGTLPIVIFFVILTCTQAQRNIAKQRFCLEPCLCYGDRISCRDADLEEIPTFTTINGAHIVDLSKNNILAVDKDSFTWGGTIQLQFLFLSANAIVYVERGAFDDLLNLEHVDLSNNELQFVPVDIVAENGRIRFLNLAQNMLVHEVPIIISDSLQVLDLSWNKLDTILPETFVNLPNLERLQLQSNNFQYISTETFLNMPNLMYIDLNINIWPCNCTSQMLFEFVTSRGLFNATAPILCRQNDSSTNEIQLQGDVKFLSNYCSDYNETNPSVSLLGDDLAILIKKDINITVNDMPIALTANEPLTIKDMPAKDRSILTTKDQLISTTNDQSILTVAQNLPILTANVSSILPARKSSTLPARNVLISTSDKDLSANDPSVLTADDMIILSPDIDDIVESKDLNSTRTTTITVYHVRYNMLNIVNLILFIVLILFVAKILVMCLDVYRSLNDGSNKEESLLYKGTQMQIV